MCTINHLTIQCIQQLPELVVGESPGSVRRSVTAAARAPAVHSLSRLAFTLSIPEAVADLGVMRYGFGRMHVAQVTDVKGGIAYLCKYLSKGRPPCLKRVRLWAAFGDVERTRVADIVTDTPFIRVLRKVMGLPSPDQVLNGEEGPVCPEGMRELNFTKALPLAHNAYLAEFDPEYRKRQAAWGARRLSGECRISAQWFGKCPAVEEKSDG